MRLTLLPLTMAFLFLLASGCSASATVATEPGYSALRLFLVDEHYLTTIRRIKFVLNFGGISQGSTELIDQISGTSADALNQLDSLAAEPPAIQFAPFDKSNIAMTTFDALRYDMARQLILDDEHFEKDLLLSQVQVLPVIIHLTQQIEANESNDQRKTWLHKLAERYIDFYKRSQDFFVLANANNGT
jgi:hypothetical protein